jgi:hypothetical protein
MDLPGVFLLTPLARWICIASERLSIPLPGRLAPITLRLMIRRMPHKSQSRAKTDADVEIEIDRPRTRVGSSVLMS